MNDDSKYDKCKSTNVYWEVTCEILVVSFYHNISKTESYVVVKKKITSSNIVCSISYSETSYEILSTLIHV